MRVAFLMQCHKNPEQINLLLDALNHPMADVFVHVDKKSQEIKDKITQREGVYILPEQQCDPFPKKRTQSRIKKPNKMQR